MNYKNAVTGRFTHISAIGFLVSFTGSIPPGFISVALIKATMAGGMLHGLLFSLGVTLVEIAFVYLALLTMSRFLSNPKWMTQLRWCSLVGLLLLTIIAGYAVFQPSEYTNNQADSSFITRISPFVAGMLIRIITPTMISFWIGWNATLFSLNLLSGHRESYRGYILGIGGGTLVAHLIYIVLSNVIEPHFTDIQQAVNWALFIALFVATTTQLWQLYQLRYRLTSL